MIPPLEHTTYYVVNDTGAAETYVIDGTDTVVTASNIAVGEIAQPTSNLQYNTVEIPVPGDAVSFIHLRARGSVMRDEQDRIRVENVGTTANPNYLPVFDTVSFRSDIVFNEKTDIRTFYDFYADKVSESFWTRHGNNLLLGGFLNTGMVFELHYYRRLPALDARLSVPTSISRVDDAYTTAPAGYELVEQEDYAMLSRLEQRTYTEVLTTDGDQHDPRQYVRSTTESANWLKDQNERVLLYGALFRSFDYLQEDDQAQKYMVRFRESIEELNMEEKTRKASGGNVQVHYNGFGRI